MTTKTSEPAIRSKCSNPACMARLTSRPLRCPRCGNSRIIYTTPELEAAR